MAKKLRKEDPSINFRLPQELKTRILKEADFCNKTVSEYLRDHMETFLNGDLYSEELAYYKNNAFINSTEFLQLVVWMYQKRKDDTYSELDKQCQNRYIGTIKKIQDNLPEDLKEEFEKVLFDLMRVKREGSYSYRFAEYSVIDKTNFDFKKLENYLLTIHKFRKEALNSL